jgi:hypothetical protein
VATQPAEVLDEAAALDDGPTAEEGAGPDVAPLDGACEVPGSNEDEAMTGPLDDGAAAPASSPPPVPGLVGQARSNTNSSTARWRMADPPLTRVRGKARHVDGGPQLI